MDKAAESIHEAEAILRRMATVAGSDDLALKLLSGMRPGDEKPNPAHQAEVRYRALVEQIPAITFLAALNGDQNEMYVSPQIEQILGFTQREWLENPVLWYTQLHPDDKERWYTEFAQTCALATRFRSEYRFIARDGRVVWILGDARVVCDESGQPLYLQGTAFDITDHKKAEETLRRGREQLEELVRERTADLNQAVASLQAEVLERRRAEEAEREKEARLFNIINTAVDGIVVIDERGTVETFNPAAEKLFGYRAAEVVGQNVSLLMPTPYREEHDEYLFRYARDGVRHIIGIGREIVGQHKDGSIFPIDLSVSEVKLKHGRRFTGVVRDIAARKRAQEELRQASVAAAEASRLKSEFLANMSHEIRTPMNGIIGMTQLALETSLSTEQREYLDTIKLSADALLGVINDILDFSKIEAGKLMLDPTRFELRSTLVDAIKPLAVRAHERRLELAYRVAPDLPDLWIGDPGRLRQVLCNLVNNAVKFTHEGEILVDVNAEGPTESVATAHEALLRFAVRDTGIGIPAHKQAAVFEAFTQADGTTTRNYGGTGLGLTICKKLVELMGGRIWVESEVGHGSSFSFTLRLERADATPATAPRERPSWVGLPVLIVDDNRTNRRILEETLHNWEMRPTTADDGETGLDALRRAAGAGHPYAVVLLDLMMPGMNGIAVLEAMVADPILARVPVVVLSSAGLLDDAKRCLELGASSYLVKPCRQSDLREALQKALGKQTAVAPAPAPVVPALLPTRHRARILLAEDNLVNQKVAIRLLEKCGFTVVVAGNGKEALTALARESFDLVLMDVQMPEMNGFEATTAIRRQEEGTGRHLPVIALTANAMKGDREDCLRAGCDDYVTKPIQRDQLLAALTKLLPRAVEE